MLAIIFLASPVFANSWSITVTWNRSVGPSLDYEEVLYDGAVKGTVQETDPTTLNFVIPELAGEVWIRSYNVQGAFADTDHVLIQPEPAAATGIIVTITSVP